MSVNCRALEEHLNTQLGKSLFGLSNVIHGLALALIGRGHVLLEGPPGLGKTRLSRAFADVLGGTFKRIQGTADLMPTDMTGVHVFNQKTETFEFQPGPLFADVVLVDEINRAGPKTQSALLEAMEERQVSVDRDTFPLADDFLVVATQNPREFEGTFPLPESQLDRFALCLPMDYLERQDEAAVLNAYSLPQVSHASPEPIDLLPADLLDNARAELAQVSVAPELTGYVQDIAAATRSSASINLGLSIRGALTLLRMARIEAALRGGDFVTPDDVLAVTPWVIPHRLILTAQSLIDGTTTLQVCQRQLEGVAIPK